MLGNVMEYCADKYDPQAYAKGSSTVTDPLVTEGEEWVVRGGNYTSDAADVRCAGDKLDAGLYDIFFFGGGQDFEQNVLLTDADKNKKADIKSAIEEEKVFLAVCGGYQLLRRLGDFS